jgi:hypothetical protein
MVPVTRSGRENDAMRKIKKRYMSVQDDACCFSFKKYVDLKRLTQEMVSSCSQPCRPPVTLMAPTNKHWYMLPGINFCRYEENIHVI